MNKDRIAAQLYTVREFTQSPERLGETLRKIADIGYAAVQVSAIGRMPPEQVKELADEAGLGICATHVGYDRLQDDLEAVIREHKLWNCRYVGLGSMPQPYRESREGYAAFVREMAPIAARLAENGLQFIYHNHRFEFARVDGTRIGMDYLLEETDPAAFGFELDVYWAQAGGGPAADWVRKLKGRMAVVHLKDMAVVRDEAVTAELGEGNMDVSGIVQACRDIGVEWYVVEQDDCRRDPFESLAISYRRLMREMSSDH
jgi:sugar phosphate isomerase/epimerase